MILWISQFFQLDNSRLNLERAEPFNSGWSVITGRTVREMDSIPRTLTVESGTIILRHTLPDFHCESHALCFRTNNEKVRVTVDGETIYSYGYNDQTDFGRYYGTVWNMVPLHKDMSGKSITVELTALSDEILPDDYTFFLDNRNVIVGTLLLNNALILLNCIVGVAVGIMLMCSGFLHLQAGTTAAKARIYLGVFVLISQVYCFSDSGLLQFFVSNKAITHFVVHSSLMLMPVPFALYLSELFPRWRIEYRRVSVLFCAYYVLRVVLYITSLVEFNRMLTTTHALILLALTYAAILCLYDTKTESNRIMLAGIFVFALFVFGTILFYYTVPHIESTFSQYTLMFCMGIDILMLFFYSALLRSTINTASHAILYEQQAYTDALTRVNNRAAFDAASKQLSPEKYPRLTLFMVDLNNLKQVNDTLGHPAGDKLICTLVKCLQEAFADMGKIYRYGGDEFIILIEGFPRDEVHAARARLDQLISLHSQHGGQNISVAVGMATRQDPSFADYSVNDLLHLADMAMYQIKAEQKTAPSSVPFVRRQRLEQLDPNTGILSFAAFKTDVYNTLMAVETPFPCIVTFDLNFFDGYNNLFGWEEGNRLLQKMTALALALCGDRGFCAHGDADTFWVYPDAPNLDILTARITEETARFQEKLGDCLLFPSFGIYCIKERMLPISDMCSRATSAKKRIKGHLDVLYTVYSTEEHQRRIDNMKLTSYMQRGLDGDEFLAYYQPKFTTEGRLAGAEALTRWFYTEDQPASPAEFTALFEKSGLILKLDWYMLKKSCALLKRMLDDGLKCVPISNNFSRLHVFEPDCAQRIRSIVDFYGVPHSLIEIELTETALVQDSERILALITALQADGFSISLDDFGSGVSSLGSLNNIRVNTIKIDRSLIETPLSGPDNDIFEFVVRLCRHLDIRTLAEGVETPQQFEKVRACGCMLVQGNYFSKPLSRDDFLQLMADRQAEIEA